MKEILQNLLLGALLPILETGGKQAIKDLLNKEKEKNLKLYKFTVIAGYMGVDVVLEDAVDKMGKKIPSELVDALKAALEESATENGITLPNIDED